MARLAQRFALVFDALRLAANVGVPFLILEGIMRASLHHRCLWAVVLLAMSGGSVGLAQPAEVQAPLVAGEIRSAYSLAEPTEFNSSDDITKYTVLVYYANETAPDEAETQNYNQLLEWLDSSDNEYAKKIATGIRNELKAFPGAVDQEVADIRHGMAELEPDSEFTAAVFTNRLARRGVFQVWQPGADEPQELPLELPQFEKLVYNSNPLSHPEVFEAALEAVGRRFDPAGHQFALVTKSHGSRNLAMTPKIILDVSETDRDTLLAELEAENIRHQEKALDNEKKLAGFKTIEPILGKEGKLSPDMNNTMDAEEESTLRQGAPLLGVTKDQYLTILRQCGEQRGMRFPVVFMEACKSQLDEVQLRDLQARGINIGILFTSDLEGLEYTTIDYADVFSRIEQGERPVQAVNATLAAKYLEQKAEREAAGR